VPVLALGERPLDADLIVFDKDGVLLDFHHLWSAVTHARVAALCAVSGIPELESGLLALLGLSREGRVAPGGLLAVGSRQDSTLAAATALHQAGLPWYRARTAAFEAFEQAEGSVDFAQSCRPLPGVVDAIERLHAAGFALAIATTDQSEGAWRFLHHAGIADRFCAVVGVDQVARSKPDPAMFQRACALAGVLPARALMVGDVDLDLLMGRAAGARATIGVLSGVGDAALLAPHADVLLRGVAALAES
jgi:HAD superfamily hydrolase (TIGR01509 family)